ncbi:MAG: hypothetical protein ACKO0Z_07070 [Betaproteobacteria bacterium]
MDLSSKYCIADLRITSDNAGTQLAAMTIKADMPLSIDEFSAEVQATNRLARLPDVHVMKELGGGTTTVNCDPRDSALTEKTLRDAVANILDNDARAMGYHEVKIDMDLGKMVMKAPRWKQQQDFAAKMFRPNDYASAARLDGFRQSAKLVCDRCATGLRHQGQGMYAAHIDGSDCRARHIHMHVKTHTGKDLLEYNDDQWGSHASIQQYANYLFQTSAKFNFGNDAHACPVCLGTGKNAHEACWHCEGEGIDPVESV